MTPQTRRTIANVLVVLAALAALSGAGPAFAAPAQQAILPAGPAPVVAVTTDPPVILAAGDIAKCNREEDALTGYLLDINPGIVLSIGDNAYEAGSLQEFTDCYGPTWGRHLDRIYPVPGNHEYLTGGASGYYTYFGDRATPLEPGCTAECAGYYSFNYAGWHVVALNSEIPSDPGTPQEQWLRADLAANPAVCTLAFWHKPRFSSGVSLGGTGQGLFNALYEYGADIVLSGHDHNYERFAPQDPGGKLDLERGIRQFVIGTGGNGLRGLRFIQPNTEASDSDTWGIVKFTLRADGYDWEFLPIPGQTWTDKGSANCVTAPGVATQPIAAAAPVVAPAGDTAATTGATTGAGAAAAPLTPVAGAQYTIVAGDTLSLIGLRYGIDWRALAAANGLTEDSIIEIGQVITLIGVDDVAATTTAAAATPAAVTPAAAVATPASASTYTVQAGDTLLGIAVRFSVSRRSLAAANNLAVGAELQVGQALTIPGQTAAAVAPVAPAAASAAAAATGGRTHTVASGDTIITIAVQYGLDWQELLRINGLQPDSLIQIGQVIRLD
jgi:LysM repeat protein